MSIEIQIAQNSDLELLLQYERDQSITNGLSDEDRIFNEWNASWRREFLEHYLPLGWSFIVKDSNHKIIGYFLGQGLSFFEGQTQCLWIEHLSFRNEAAARELLNLAIKLSREKHFQRVYLPTKDSSQLKEIAATTFKTEHFNETRFFIKTTRTSQ